MTTVKKMKTITAMVLCLALVLLAMGCGTREEEDVELEAEEVQEYIVYNLGLGTVQDDNYVSSAVDAERNVVIVRLKDISGKKQNEFIYRVFAASTGSTYINYLKEHSMLVFEKAE